MFKYKLLTWLSDHKLTAILSIIAAITVIYSFFSNGIAGHYWSKVLFAIIFYVFLIAIVFFYEHADVVADPDTKENKMYKNISLIIFIIGFIAVCVYGNYVMSFW